MNVSLSLVLVPDLVEEVAGELLVGPEPGPLELLLLQGPTLLHPPLKPTAVFSNKLKLGFPMIKYGK